MSRRGLIHRAGGAATAVTAGGAAALGGAILGGVVLVGGMDARDGDGGDALVEGLGWCAIAGSCRGGH